MEIDLVRFVVVVAHEDIIQIRKIVKSEIFNYHKMDCVLTLPLSPNGKFPVTHWTSFDAVSNETWQEILMLCSILKKNDIFYACSRKYAPADFWNFLGLQQLPVEDWREAVKISLKKAKKHNKTTIIKFM